MNAVPDLSKRLLPIGVPMGRKVRIQDRTFQPFLYCLSPETGAFIEEMYRVEVCFDSGEVKWWTFDDLKWWLREHGSPRKVYEQVLDAAMALDTKIRFGDEG